MSFVLTIVLVGIALYLVYKNRTEENDDTQKDFEEIYEETISKKEQKDKYDDTNFDDKA